MNDDLLLSGLDLRPAAQAPTPDARLDASEPEPMRLLAREFEAMLILQMLKQMQQSVSADAGDDTGFGSNPLSDALFQEVAQQLTRSGGFGLTEHLVRGLGGPDAAPSVLPPGGLASPTFPVAAPAPMPALETPPRPLPEPATPAGVAVPLPMDSRVSSRFGWRADPFTGDPRFHGGVDIPAAHGQDVPAARAGRVAFAGAQGGYGMTVVVEHEDGIRTRYAHLSAAQVAEGDAVRAGQVVGQVGQTGRATGPHLHFEVLQGGQRLDPQLAARRFAAALKKVGPVADLPVGGPDNGPDIAVE